MPSNENSFRFRPKARILRLLGDQLIGNSRLAIFELVKNAYDADAANVKVTLSNLGQPDASIRVRDDGDGMDRETIENVWFVPGAAHREEQRAEGRRTHRFNRLPLGEKGLGRFAVHKLGDEIRLITRSRNEAVERIVDIDWRTLLDNRFLEELSIEVHERAPSEFPGSSHGTQIEIRALRQEQWTRGDLRRLYRQVTSICSPFDAPNEFDVSLDVPDRMQDLAGLPSVGEILDRAFWHFEFTVGEDGFTWTYRFVNRLTGMNVPDRTVSGQHEKLALDDRTDEPAEETMPVPARKSHRAKVAVDQEFLKGIGTLSGEFFVFDRDKEVISRMVESEIVTKYLNENGGIRVYRDGIRVYNYGETGDDWLGLDLRRVNQPTRRVSRNVVIGAVNLNLQESTELKEKTNREGFVENDAYARLRRIMIAALNVMETERSEDKERLRRALKGDSPMERFSEGPPFEDLRREARKLGADKPLEPYIKRIESEFKSLKETLLNVGTSGIGLAVVFHEIDRGVRELYALIRDARPLADAERKARELSLLLDGFSTLLRRSDKKRLKASDIVRQARDISSARLRFHQTNFESPLLNGQQADIEAVMAQGLMLGAMTNLIDNSLYWLRVKWPDVSDEKPPFRRKIYIGTWLDADGGPAIVVADNGPGFKDGADLLTKPFFSRRPDGMGLGLYYVRLAMDLVGGSVQFPSAQDVGISDVYEGGVVALVFGKESKDQGPKD